MKVALVGPPKSGKTTLFAAVAAAGGSHVDTHRPDQPHMAVVKIPDERIDWLSEVYKPEKRVYAELEFHDLPGLDLSDEAGRNHAKVHWAAMRQSDLLAFVLREFPGDSVAAYRSRIDAVSDAQEMLDEMLLADLEQVLNRIEKLEAGIKKPTPKRDEMLKELELMGRLKTAIEAEKPISQVVSGAAEDKLIRSFAFLSQKPSLAVLNCDEGSLGKPLPALPGGLEALRVSARIEEEIAQLPPEDRAAFMADLGIASSARDVLIRQCSKALKLVSFLTYGEDECRAWIIPAGTDAVTAAEEIHSDIARGFIRAETVAFADVKAAGDVKAAKAAGKMRLEGKNYVIQDGDVLTFRFSV